MLKKILLILFICTVALSLNAFEEDYLNKITFINNTGADIWYIFLSPGDSDEWGLDILGSERTLEDNGLLSFYILYPDYENYFDIMAIDEEGNTFILFDELISDDGESNIILNSSDLDDENPEMDFIEIGIENTTDFEMFYIFISPSDSEMWGVDMMDDEQTLAAYETLYMLVPWGEGTYSYDLMGVDEDLDEYTFSFEIDFDDIDEDTTYTYAIEYSDLVTE